MPVRTDTSMKTDKTTILDLLQLQRRFVVPLFQRGYVWNETDQWQPLWDDVAAQAAAAQRHDSGPHGTLQSHFLGALVLHPAPVGLKRVPIVNIIDGQQRLVTLQTLLAAIRDATQDLNDDWIQKTLAALLENPPPLLSPDERFKVWPNKWHAGACAQRCRTGLTASG